MQNWNGKLDASIVEENVPIQFAAEFVKAIESDLLAVLFLKQCMQKNDTLGIGIDKLKLVCSCD